MFSIGDPPPPEGRKAKAYAQWIWTLFGTKKFGEKKN